MCVQLNLVQRRLAETASVNPYPTPRIHAMVYNVGTGELEKVNWVRPPPEAPEDSQ